MHESLNRQLWNADGYCFAGDFYLYIVLQLWVTALRGGTLRDAIRRSDFFPTFFYGQKMVGARDLYESTAILGKALIDNNAYRFSMDQRISDEPEGAGKLDSISIAPPTADASPRGLLDPSTKPFQMKDVNWFNEACRRLELD